MNWKQGWEGTKKNRFASIFGRFFSPLFDSAVSNAILNLVVDDSRHWICLGLMMCQHWSAQNWIQYRSASYGCQIASNGRKKPHRKQVMIRWEKMRAILMSNINSIHKSLCTSMWPKTTFRYSLFFPLLCHCSTLHCRFSSRKPINCSVPRSN